MLTDEERQTLRWARKLVGCIVEERGSVRAHELERKFDALAQRLAGPGPAPAAEASFEEVLANSSLGSVPMRQHTDLLEALGALVTTVSGVIDEVGAHMTRERRRELWLALEVVKQAAARG